MSETPRILIVEARFYDALADALLEGAKETLKARGADFDVVTVPGALEIPPAIAMAEEAGRFPTAPRYDGYVALGTVIRGETYHFEVVSNESARAIMALTLDGMPIGNGILTVENDEQAWVRARVADGNKGGGAAEAALTLLRLKRRVGAA